MPTEEPIVPEETTEVDPLIKQAQDILAGEDGIVSSDTSEVDNFIGQSVEEIKAAQVAKETGIKAGTERAKISVQKAGEERLTGARELQMGVGPASAFSLVARISKDTEESLRDLDLREQEALSLGQTEAASQIAGLKLQQMTFRQQTKQQAFSNILAMMGIEFQKKGFELQQEGLKIQREEISSRERSEMARIALDFGVDVENGDTLESIVTKARATGQVDERRELELKRLQSEIDLNKAQAARALKGEDVKYTDDMIDLIASAAVKSPEVVALIKDPEAMAKITNKVAELNAPREWEEDELFTEARKFLSSNTDFNTALLTLKSDPRITNKDAAEKALRLLYDRPKSTGLKFPSPKGLKGVLKAQTFLDVPGRTATRIGQP